MKRTRLNRRSKTNSRPAEDIDVRRQYLEDNPDCELSIWFCEHFDERDGHDPHHCFGGRGGRHDLVTNLVTVSRSAHDWLENWKTDGRVLTTWIKHVKNELDLDEFKKASGSFLAGWLMRAEATHDFVKPYLDKLRKLYP